jgi:membrane-bound lytic murein transglycosylase B
MFKPVLIACYWVGMLAGPGGAAAAPALVQKPSAIATSESAAPGNLSYAERGDVAQFGAQVAERRGLNAQWVQATLQRARYVPSVARFIMPPPVGVPKNWAAYRARFIEPVRIREGAAFWRAHRRWLAHAETLYGVPASIVVGIIGVETIYGRQMGSFRTLDALATLAFDFPAGRKDRTPFFRAELENFLVMCQQQNMNPQDVMGSYAGAMGLPQFMPSSVNQYAVDLDGDGRTDLLKSPADAIGSVAHYLAQFGWQTGLPTHFEVTPPLEASSRAVLLAPDILPSFTAAEFSAQGATLPEAARALPGKLALVELQNGEAPPSYVAGTTNFYAITRYNWSSYYALAVIELGQAVAHRMALAP